MPSTVATPRRSAGPAELQGTGASSRVLSRLPLTAGDVLLTEPDDDAFLRALAEDASAEELRTLALPPPTTAADRPRPVVRKKKAPRRKRSASPAPRRPAASPAPRRPARASAAPAAACLLYTSPSPRD